MNEWILAALRIWCINALGDALRILYMNELGKYKHNDDLQHGCQQSAQGCSADECYGKTPPARGPGGLQGFGYTRSQAPDAKGRPCQRWKHPGKCDESDGQCWVSDLQSPGLKQKSKAEHGQGEDEKYPQPGT